MKDKSKEVLWAAIIILGALFLAGLITTFNTFKYINSEIEEIIEIQGGDMIKVDKAYSKIIIYDAFKDEFYIEEKHPLKIKEFLKSKYNLKHKDEILITFSFERRGIDDKNNSAGYPGW